MKIIKIIFTVACIINFINISIAFGSSPHASKVIPQIIKNVGDIDDLTVPEKDELIQLYLNRNFMGMKKRLDEIRQTKTASKVAAAVSKDAEIKIQHLEKQLEEKEDAIEKHQKQLQESKDKISELTAKQALQEEIIKVIEEYRELIKEIQIRLETERDPLKQQELKKKILEHVQAMNGYKNMASNTAPGQPSTGHSSSGSTGSSNPGHASSQSGSTTSSSGNTTSGGSPASNHQAGTHGNAQPRPGGVPPPPPPPMKQTLVSKIDLLLKRVPYDKAKIEEGDSFAKKSLYLSKILIYLKSLVAPLTAINDNPANIKTMDATWNRLSFADEIVLKKGFIELLQNSANPAKLFETLANPKQFRLMEHFGVKDKGTQANSTKPSTSSGQKSPVFPDQTMVEDMLGQDLKKLLQIILAQEKAYEKSFQNINNPQRYITCERALKINPLPLGWDKRKGYALCFSWDLIEKGERDLVNALGGTKIAQLEKLVEEYEEELKPIENNQHLVGHVHFIKGHLQELKEKIALINKEIAEQEEKFKTLVDTFESTQGKNPVQRVN